MDDFWILDSSLYIKKKKKTLQLINIKNNN